MATNYKFDPANIPGAIVEKEGPREKNGTISPDTDLEMLLQSASVNASGTKYGANGQGSANSAADSSDESFNAQPVGANNELLGEQKPRVVAALRELMLQFRSEGLVARRHEVRRIKQARLFWQGLQYAWWNPNDMSWHLPYEASSDAEKSVEDVPRYQFVTNLYQAFGLSFIALISQDTPATRFFPQSAQIDVDVAAARAASDVAELIEQNNKVQQMLTGAGYFLWTDGKIGGYGRYVSDAQRFGWHNDDIIEEATVRVGEDSYVCPKCNAEVPAGADPQDSDDDSVAQVRRTRGASDVTDSATPVGDLTDATEQNPGFSEPELQSSAAPNFLEGALCPSCGENLGPEHFRPAPLVTVPRYVGTRRVPNGQEVITILGGLELNTPVWANEMHEFPYLQWQQEVHVAKLRAAYPQAADKIIIGGPVEAEDVYARASRVAVAQGMSNSAPGDSLYNLITFTRTWIRPWAFYAIEDKQTREELLSLFPEGCYVAFAGETYCESRNETLDDHWRVMHALPGDGQNRPSVGDSLIQIQERYNTLSNIQAETYEFGIPPIYADPQVLDFDALGSQTAEPAAHYPARAKPGQPLSASFFQPAAAQIPEDMLEHQQELAGPISQFLTGLFPAVFGGAQQGNKTAAGYAMARDQALGRLGIVWRRLKQFYSDIMLLSVDTFRKNRANDVEIPLMGAAGEFESKWIRLADLKGNIQAHPEADESFPRQASQQRAVLQQLMASSDPMIAQALSDPENIGFIKSVFGLEELSVPGEDAREKQLREITQLLASVPIVVPVTVQVPGRNEGSFGATAASRETRDAKDAPQDDGKPEMGSAQPSGGIMPSSETHIVELPSVPIDDLLDDHAAELAEVRRWASSDAGQIARAQNPLGFANVRAHAAAHQAAIARQGAQAAMQQAVVSAATGAPAKRGK